MKAKNTGEELIKASYRLPKKTLEELEQIAVAERRSINDELICLLEKGILEWRRENAITTLKETTLALSSLKERIAEYAVNRCISIEQASDELGITKLISKALPEIEAIQTDPSKEKKKAAGQ